MKKDNSGAVAIVAVNMIILSLLVINRNYKTHIEKLAKQAAKIKKEKNLASLNIYK